jgi:hypothetical protein
VKLYGATSCALDDHEIAEMAPTDECLACGGDPHRTEVAAMRCLAKALSIEGREFSRAAGMVRLKAFELAKAAKREVGFRARSGATS